MSGNGLNSVGPCGLKILHLPLPSSKCSGRYYQSGSLSARLFQPFKQSRAVQSQICWHAVHLANIWSLVSQLRLQPIMLQSASKDRASHEAAGAAAYCQLAQQRQPAALAEGYPTAVSLPLSRVPFKSAHLASRVLGCCSARGTGTAACRRASRWAASRLPARRRRRLRRILCRHLRERQGLHLQCVPENSVCLIHQASVVNVAQQSGPWCTYPRHTS